MYKKRDWSTVDVVEELSKITSEVHGRYQHEPEFLQAYDEVLETITPMLKKSPRYIPMFRIMSEPERIITFRVLWVDDDGELQMNRGYRVQFNSALGPYKGGLRLHPSVNLSILKFLGFEQILKNALTGLAMGGAKGGSDFDPKGKSDNEVRSFCQAFMTELYRHIGPDTDVPAGDIGVGGREIGFLYGQYRKLENGHHGVLTGKGMLYGGSLIRPEATGYGAVYFAQNLLGHLAYTGTGYIDDQERAVAASIKGKRCLVSGAGNAAQYTCEKLLELGAVVLTASDSNGTLFFKDGMTSKDLQAIMELKNEKRGRLSELTELDNAEYKPDCKPWGLVEKVNLAFPSATQNEINGEDAKHLIDATCCAIVEVANMPISAEARKEFKAHGVIICPGKAANCGGVAVSGLEMSQNAARTTWTREEVDGKLQEIMKNAFDHCLQAFQKYTEEPNSCDLEQGANIAGFIKVADAMHEQGLY
ncbi:glutamate dehydrogenase NAD(P) protein [Gregarina niphandrodes]|uniref:Glutamate dehydrogenase n=1 Tax=Gregarina niphandrodes TaxID=110365 RepID=A0A023BAI3_GRENI|nr:glutamate dehydrogenase NAD(P) protein [Gregarina niphandrodes]EZG78313.1 glutamate dehydrogenase NAD(P) protein [Gregarina niphandrodes]|eukprot:XP_011129351.1 glutamate dehydrogenase NAD(P) protein [Gregarina niphandrodes]